MKSGSESSTCVHRHFLPLSNNWAHMGPRCSEDTDVTRLIPWKRERQQLTKRFHQGTDRIDDRKRAYQKTEDEKQGNTSCEPSLSVGRDTRLCQGKPHGKENRLHQEGKTAFWVGYHILPESPLVFWKGPGSRFPRHADEIWGRSS